MTYGMGGDAGGPQNQWSGYGYEPEAKRGASGGVIALFALVAVLVIALLGAVAYLFLRSGGVDGQSAAPAAQSVVTSSQVTAVSTSAQEPITETAYTTPPQRETVTVTRSAQPQAPVGSYPSGADSSGWTSNTQSRCNAGDAATMIGRTAQASFSICVNPDNGRYYYRGSASGSGVEVDDPSVSGSTATVRNNGVIYSISPSGMVIYEGGAVISSQPMVDFWVG